MVSIKKITIYGFKSFGPRRNIIDIPRGFTVITGPNGGGKSNVIDAVRFALGELSPHSLRVSRLSELIYESNGSKSSYARVSVVFDNTDRGIPIDADEVTVTRRLMQSGESVYQVNGKSVSRMDLLAILSAANIKPSGYNIISQGAVLGIAETSPEELRKLIEEIAGTAEYDRRKEEALEQLDQAERNIAVARAGTAEVKQRVRQLELEKTQLIRRSILERELYALRAEKLRRSIVELESEMERILRSEEEFQKRKAELEEELSRLASHRASLLEQMAVLENQLSESEKKERELGAMMESNRLGLERIKTMIRSEGTRLSSTRRQLLELASQELNAERRIEELRQSIAELSQRMEKNTARLSLIEEEYEKLQRRRSELSERIRELDEEVARRKNENEKLRRKILERERELEIRGGRLASLAEKLEEKKNRLSEVIDGIASLENALSNYQESLRQSLEEKDKVEELISDASGKIETHRTELERLSRLLGEVSKLIIEGRAKINPDSSYGRQVVDIISSNMSDEVIGVLSDLFKPPRGLEALYLMILKDRLNTLVVRRNSVAAALALAAAEVGVALSVISVEGNFSCPGDGCLACMAETMSADGLRALHIAMKGARLLRDKQGFRTGEPAISINGAYWDGGGFLASLGEVNITQKAIDAINELMIVEESLKTRINEHESIIKNLQKTIENLRTEKLELETRINALKEKIKLDEKTLKAIREEKLKLEEAIKLMVKESEMLREERERIKSDIEELSKSLPKEDTIEIMNRKELIEQLEALNKSLNNYSEIRSELLSEKKATAQRIEEFTSELKKLEHMLEELSERRILLENASNELKKNVMNYAGRFREELYRQRELLEEVQANSKVISTLKEQVATIRSRLDEVNNKLESLRGLISEVDNQLQGIKLSKMELTMRRNSLEEKLREIPLQNEGDLVCLDQDIRDEIYMRLEEELNTMGPVNQLAAMQYVELVANYKHRSFRIAELEKERREILRVIEMIDSEKQELFLTTMKKISDGFGYFFNRLTGGEAWLELTDPEKPNDSGVEMIVKFVGKSPRSSRSVSGGEKSVAAVSLLMSFQGLTPADFLIFDEVDAHMDASYTRNLSELFSEMSNKTQIIAISLKDVMAERAELLVGVYNQSGESRIIMTKMGEKTSEKQDNRN